MPKPAPRIAVPVSIALVLALGAGRPAGAEGDAASVVGPGKKVSIEFTVTLDDGRVPDSNVGKGPLVFEAGANKILPGLERELVGMKQGETRTVVLSAENGYGPVRAELFRAVPVEHIPEQARQAGAVVIANDPEGHQVPVRVHEVKSDEIVVDFNHPFAGQAVTFNVKVVDIE